MDSDVAFAAVAFVSLLVVYNPLSAIPIFVALTMDDSRRERRSTAFWGVASSVAVLVVFAFAGTSILQAFSITTEALQVTAGIIFFGIGSDMLQAKRARTKTTRREQDEAASRDSLAVIPLGLPTLTGPGSIVTVVTLAGQAANGVQLASVYAASVMVGVVAFPMLVVAPRLLEALGRTGLNVVTRMMGLMIMAVGVQFVINGIEVVAGSLGIGTP